MPSQTIGIRFSEDLLAAVVAYGDGRGLNRSAAVDRLLREALGLPEKRAVMGQDQGSGAAANEYGRLMGQRIAAKIGAEPDASTGNGNEFVLGGERVALKCARTRTTSVGVTYKMLERLNSVIGAFEAEDGRYDLYVHPVSYLCEWDTCAPEIIAREAGATVTDCLGQPLRYNKQDPTQPHGMLVMAPGLSPRTLEVVRGVYLEE